LTPANVEKVLAELTGRTKLEAQEYIAALYPRPVLGPSVRAQPVTRSAAGGAAPVETAEASPDSVTTVPSGGPGTDSAPGRELGASPAAPAQPGVPSEPASSSIPGEAPQAQEDRRPSPNILEPATAEVYNWRFSAGREFREKFERLAEVLGIKNPVKNMEKVISEAIEFTLERKDPQRRYARRVEREARRQEREAESRESGGAPPCLDKVSDRAAEPVERVVARSAARPETATQEAGTDPGGSPAEETAASRHVPVALRDETLERAGYQCEYVGPNGQRCSERVGLEIDHCEEPFSVSKRHDKKNLRALCPRHNAYEARKRFGEEFVAGKIEQARASREARRRELEASGAR
jgi:hypothetical protein